MTGWASLAAALLLAVVSEPVLRFADPTIDESSGLVDAGRHVLTVNDSGDDAVVYVVSKQTGETVGRTRYSTGPVVDVEALAPGPGGSLWVGDIGDNGSSRGSIAVYRLPVPSPGDRTVAGQRYDLAYEDGPRDAEALLVHPRTGRLFVVSKGLFRGAVYRAPAVLRDDRVNVLERVAAAPSLVTDGAFLPDGRHVLLRDYGSLSAHRAGSFRERASMPLPRQEQGEGLAATAGPRVLVSTEGAGSRVLSVRLSDRVREAVEPADPALATSESGDERTAGEDQAAEEPADRWRLVLLTLAVLATVLGLRVALRRRDRS